MSTFSEHWRKVRAKGSIQFCVTRGLLISGALFMSAPSIGDVELELVLVIGLVALNLSVGYISAGIIWTLCELKFKGEKDH